MLDTNTSIAELLSEVLPSSWELTNADGTIEASVGASISGLVQELRSCTDPVRQHQLRVEILETARGHPSIHTPLLQHLQHEWNDLLELQLRVHQIWPAFADGATTLPVTANAAVTPEVLLAALRSIPAPATRSTLGVRLKHPAGRGGGVSHKLVNLPHNIRQVLEHGLHLGVVAVHPDPIALTLAMLLLGYSLYEGTKIHLTELEASIYWGALQTGAQVRPTHEEQICERTNQERRQVGYSGDLHLELVRHQLELLARYKCVQSCGDGLWKVMEELQSPGQ